VRAVETAVTEDDLEQACIEWLKELGWSYAHGEAISPGGEHSEREHYTHVVLAGRLSNAVSRFNPELPTDAVETVVAKLLNYAGQSLVEANREIYVWLRDGVPVEVEVEGHRRIVTAQVFNFDDADSNDWLIVNQYTVKGSKTCRPDLVAFVNGIPLGVIELKNPADEDTDVTAAFNQIQNYKSEIQQLFEPNLCCVISDGAVARVGSITADEERFMPWRVAEGIEHPEEHLELEVLIRGLFRPATFLSYFRYFVAFQNTGSGTAKMIAGYHQYHGVQKAAQRAVEAATQTNDGKGGVMWFTQGSGKSLIALFYVCLLRERPELKNPTIVVVTDRNDLDGQLYETFAASETTLRTAPTQAQDVPELKELLSSQPAGGVFFTTIQKFQPDEPGKPMEMLCNRSNVIVICDEAHRTQYGFKAKLDSKTGQMKYGLAKHMREALPNAVYLGLTGTPISGDDKDTQAVFGDYVDIYDVLASQRDGTTVPIHYESRIIDLAVNQDELDQLDDDLDELLDSEDDSIKGQAASRLARLESIAMADGRLEKLAKDLVQHWQSRLEVIDGKAMIVAMSRAAAVALYDEIIKEMPGWHNDDLDQGAIKVVMTSPSSDPPALRKHAHAEKAVGETDQRPGRFAQARDRA
jgi:type I restriction enzyme R subunit